MSSQQSESQVVSQSQPLSQPQTHTDFLVGIATENASLKVQIKQEYDNSCALVYQINKSIREIDSCKRDLNKFKELQEAKFSELKRLEADMDRERIRSNIDHMKQEKDLIELEELRRRVKRVSISKNYEQMVQNQKEINSSHPCVMLKDSKHNMLKQREIELAVLKKRIEEWQRKENQLRTIQGMKLNAEVVELAKIFTQRRMELRKKRALADQLDKKKVELQKLMENRCKKKQADPVVFVKPAAPPFAVTKNISVPKLSSNIAPSFQGLSGSIAKQSDLMKYFQQVSAFKTPHTQFTFPSKFSRSFSPHNVNQKLKVPFSRTLKSPSVDHQSVKASAVRMVGEKVKHVEEPSEYHGNSNLNDKSDPPAEVNVSACVPPVQISSTSQDSIILNSEVAAINSQKEAVQSTDTASGEVANGQMVSGRANSCRSNCSTPVSVKSVGSQKGRPDRPRSRISTLKSPRPADSVRRSANFSPISKATFTPKMLSKRNTSTLSSWKPYRSPDILQKITHEKLSSANRTSGDDVSARPPKEAKGDRDASSVVTSSASINVGRVEENANVATKLTRESIGESTRICPSSPINHEVENTNSLKDNQEANSNKDNNLQPTNVEILSSEASHSKYFPNSSNKPRENTRVDGNCVGETYNNSLQSGGGNEFSGSVSGASKANSTGSNSSHFSSMVMRKSSDESSPPLGNFLMPFSCSGNNGNGFGFGNSNDKNGFTLTGDFTSADTSSNTPFVFKFSDDSSKPAFSLF